MLVDHSTIEAGSDRIFGVAGSKETEAVSQEIRISTTDGHRFTAVY